MPIQLSLVVVVVLLLEVVFIHMYGTVRYGTVLYLLKYFALV
jgi:hypothetical protein